MRLIYVREDASPFEPLRLLLETITGAKVMVAHSAEECRHILSHEGADIVISDMHSPDATLQLFLFLRSSGCKVRFIALLPSYAVDMINEFDGGYARALLYDSEKSKLLHLSEVLVL
jgi:DNA-binding NtrC family response regulator